MASQSARVNSHASRFVPLVLRSGYKHPFMLYGTAWKEEKTGALTALALKNGFEGFDTANYPTAYEEPLTGDGFAEVLKSGVKRNNICVQSKFTPAFAHAEGKCPFDKSQNLEFQVRQSIEQSFEHLKTDHIDLFLLHAPFEDDEDNIVAWKVFEAYVPDRIGHLGVSNFTFPVFKKLYDGATIKPEIVQNRFYKDTGYDIELRAFMAEKGIVYQAYHLFKANHEILDSDLLVRVKEKFSVGTHVAFYMLVLGLGSVSIVNGTTHEEHMKEDLREVQILLENQEKILEVQEFMAEFEAMLVHLAQTKASI